MNHQPARPNPLRLGWEAARTNALPGVIIAAIALGVLTGYHRWPAFHDALESVRDWKERFGFLFSAVSTAFFAGLLPLLFRLIPRETRNDPQWRQLPFFLLFWAAKGIEFDLLYRFQAWAFGDSAEPRVVILKVIIDQLVYGPFWAVPTMVLGYLWKDSGFRVRATMENLGPHWISRRCLPLLLANWCVWIPAVAVIYNLPLTLQLPLQNLILCLYVLLVMLLVRNPGETE